ncbi:MAG: Fur family transcriptional regulator [Pseudomonadota bacterium]
MTGSATASTEKSDLTAKQRLVMDALSDAEGPMSAYKLLELLRDDGFRAPLQVYRALDKLLEAGLVHRLESLNAFVACRHPSCENDTHEITVFTICETCGAVYEGLDEDVSRHLKAFAQAADFAVNKSVIELRGACAACRA